MGYIGAKNLKKLIKAKFIKITKADFMKVWFIAWK